MGALFYTDVTDRDAEAWRRMLLAIESTLPTASLTYASATLAKPRAVDDPGEWCARHFTGRNTALVTNATDGEYISFGPVYIYPVTAPEGRALLQLLIRFPPIPKFIECIPALVEAFGPASHAYWGSAAPSEVGASLADGAGRISPNPGVPRPPSWSPPPSVLIPSLGWVCWWSEASCRYLEFSSDDPRASLFAKVTAVPGDGVVLQLTDDLLDLERPEHLATVTAIYRAFPEVDQQWDL